MQSIIKVQNLSKRYAIGRRRQLQYGTLRESLFEIVSAPFKKLRGEKDERDFMWALKDVSFELKPGEVVGIVGRNGAGKSTLLKVLSQITEPTSGRAEIYGRVGSLLEVGTGFHMELSGRDNIYLSGAIMGMRRKEIERKFDEIVAFSEVEKMLDTAVKFYSSGMYMRLAFAIAAHLDPEILIVDEVLAVGDSAFQKKCLGKMGEVAEGGKTVLFVSHNASVLTRLCQTGIYLESGRVKNQGDVKTILAEYQGDIEKLAAGGANKARSIDEVKEGEAKFIGWELENPSSGSPHICFSREECCFVLTFVSKKRSRLAHIVITLLDDLDQVVVSGYNMDCNEELADFEPGVHQIRWRVNLPLKAGNYQIRTFIHPTAEREADDDWWAFPLLTVLPEHETQVHENFRGSINLPSQIDVKKVSSL